MELNNYIDLLRTSKTYATPANAERALRRAASKLGCRGQRIPYVIAVAPGGRYAPVVVGADFIPFAHHGVTVAG